MSQKIYLTVVAIGGLAWLASAAVAQPGDTQKPRTVKRVARPTFTPEDSAGVFFEDLFRDGLVGQRPEPTTAIPESTASLGQSNSETTNKWTPLISATTLEDEVKYLQQQLSRNISTASKFRSQHVQVRQTFEQLSLMFGVIREYEGNIRWKRDSPAAQRTFETAAIAARQGSEVAFTGSQRKLEQLIQMVRGDRFPGNEKPPETLDWSSVIGHSSIMERMQEIHDQLKAASSNEKSFKQERATIIHSAQLVTMMAKTIQQPPMDYGDDDEYLAFAQQMQASATDTARAALDSNFVVMSAAANRVSQSCTDCHAVYR